MRIGLVIHDLEFGDSYFEHLWKVAFDWGQYRGVEIVLLPGRQLGSKAGNERALNALYELGAGRGVDALLLAIISMDGRGMRPADLGKELFPGKPVATIAWKHPLHSCISLDNRRAYAGLLRHLVRDHGYRRIACVMGPLENLEAKARFETWKSVMEEEGLPCGPDLAIQGDWMGHSAHLVTDALLALDPRPEAVAVCSDEMAFALMKMLTDRGLRIPADIAVTGYDDTGLARYCEPGLTTMHQPLELQAVLALELLARQVVRGREIVDRELDSLVVIRSSCGCPEEAWTERTTPDMVLGYPGLEGLFPGVDLAWLAQRGRHSPGENLLVFGGQGSQRDAFLREARNILAPAREGSAYLQQASYLFAGLSAASDMGSLMARLSEGMARMGVDCFRLSLAADNLGTIAPWLVVDSEASVFPASPPMYRVVLELPESTMEAGRPVGTGSRAVPRAEILDLTWPPGDGPGPTHRVVLPLVVGYQWYGIVECSFSQENKGAVRSFQEILASSLDRIWRVESLLKASASNRVRISAGEERLRSLSSMVAGLAHEINTPLGNSITSASYLSSLVSESPYEPQVREILDMLQGNLRRTVDLVEKFRKLDTATIGDQSHDILLCELLQLLVDRMADRAQGAGVELAFECTKALTCTTQPEVIMEVVGQLLDNALVHSFETGGSRGRAKVWLRAMTDPEDLSVMVEVEDNGCGMQAQEASRVFEPFYTTKRGRGRLGIGLTVVYNLVTSSLGGSISCRSVPGSGTLFRLRLPHGRALPD